MSGGPARERRPRPTRTGSAPPASSSCAGWTCPRRRRSYPLIWEPGDTVELRPPSEIEGRTAILNVVLARCFGMPGEAAMAWLLDAHLLDHLTKPEWSFVATGEGDHRSFALHLEALYALAWLLGLVPHLDPTEPAPDGLIGSCRTCRPRRRSWPGAAGPTRSPAPAPEAAIVLDLFYCLDWAYLEAERRRIRLPGLIDSNAIGQRRWALEWAVVLRGPYQDAARRLGRSRPLHLTSARAALRHVCAAAPGDRRRRRGRVGQRVFAQADAGCRRREPGRGPPVPAAEQRHRGRHQQAAHDGRVDEHGHGQAEPDLFDVADPGGGEAAEHDDHEQGGRGDDPAGVLQAPADRGVGRPRPASTYSLIRPSRNTS